MKLAPLTVASARVGRLGASQQKIAFDQRGADTVATLGLTESELAMITGSLMLDDRNRVARLAHLVYGQVPTGQGLVTAGNWLGPVGLKLDYSAVCLGSRGIGGGGNRPGIRGSR